MENVEYNVIEKMIGKTAITVVNKNDELLVFTFTDGTSCTFYHEQDCCEDVSIDDICGELSDLIDKPLLVAEENWKESENDDGSNTWTFYRFGTANGNVSVKWYGVSNGYYSESVNIRWNG